MSEIRRYDHRPGGMILSEGWGDYVRWDDHWPEVERLKAERDAAARNDYAEELERVFWWKDRTDYETIAIAKAIQVAEVMAQQAAKTERARCIRAIQRMLVPVDQVDGATRAIAAIEAMETEDTP